MAEDIDEYTGNLMGTMIASNNKAIMSYDGKRLRPGKGKVELLGRAVKFGLSSHPALVERNIEIPVVEKLAYDDCLQLSMETIDECVIPPRTCMVNLVRDPIAAAKEPSAANPVIAAFCRVYAERQFRKSLYKDGTDFTFFTDEPFMDGKKALGFGYCMYQFGDWLTNDRQYPHIMDAFAAVNENPFVQSLAVSRYFAVGIKQDWAYTVLYRKGALQPAGVMLRHTLFVDPETMQYRSFMYKKWGIEVKPLEAL